MNDLDKVVTTASPFVMLTTILVFVALLLLLIGYIFMGISLYKINKNQKNKGNWMAWIPIFNIYLLGKLGCNKIVGILSVITLIVCTSFTISINSIEVESVSFISPILSSILFFIVDIIMIISAARLYKKSEKKPIKLVLVSIITLGMAIPFFLFSIRNKNSQVAHTPNNDIPLQNIPIELVASDIKEPINSIWQEKNVEEISPLPLPEQIIESDTVAEAITPIGSIKEEENQPLNASLIESTPNPLPHIPSPISQTDTTIIDFAQLSSNQNSSNSLQNLMPQQEKEITPSFLESEPKEEIQQSQKLMSVEELLRSQNFK